MLKLFHHCIQNLISFPNTDFRWVKITKVWYIFIFRDCSKDVYRILHSFYLPLAFFFSSFSLPFSFLSVYSVFYSFASTLRYLSPFSICLRIQPMLIFTKVIRFSRLRLWVGYFIYSKFTPASFKCCLNGCFLIKITTKRK